MAHVGTVVRWEDRGFGYIQCKDFENDVFVHYSAFGGGDLEVGAEVRFDAEPDRKGSGKRATMVEGAAVRNDRGGGGGGGGDRDRRGGGGGGGYDRDRRPDRRDDRDRERRYDDRGDDRYERRRDEPRYDDRDRRDDRRNDRFDDRRNDRFDDRDRRDRY